MSKERQVNWPNPTIDQAIRASMMVANYYCAPFSKIDVGEEPVEVGELTDGEAEQRLLGLADQIMAGAVNTHVQVARTVRSLGYRIGALGSVSTEIDLAAFRVAHAVFQKQGAFLDGQPPSQTSPTPKA